MQMEMILIDITTKYQECDITSSDTVMSIQSYTKQVQVQIQ